MLKAIFPLNRRPETDLAAFREFWRAVHAPHVVNAMRPERYCVTYFDAPATLGGVQAQHDLVYDGMAELWFRDWDHFHEATQSERARALNDVDGFSEWIEPITDAFFTTENMILDGPTPEEHVKWVAFVQKKDEVSREELFAAWNDEHSPRVKLSIALTNGACFKYTTSHANQGRESRWDGIASLWYEDANAARAGTPPREQEGPPDPFPGLIDAAATVILEGREITIVR